VRSTFIYKDHKLLYFIRHGESLANEQNYFAGTLDSPLTRLGRRQAREAAAGIRKLNLDFDEVHISTLERARETAQIVLGDDLARHARIVFTDALIERDFGIFAGENKTLLKKSLGYERFDHFIHDPAGTPPGGESWMDMYARCRKYYDEVLAPLEQAGKRILVVAHKYIVEVFALIASGRSPSEYLDFKLPNSRPLSWDDLTRLTSSSSSALNRIADHVEIYLPHWALGGALAGFALALLDMTPSAALTNVMVILLLAVNAFFLALRIDASALDPRRESHRASLVTLSLVRLAIGGWLLFLVSEAWAPPIGLLLLMPPALSVPTFSLSRGGDYFFAARNTLLLSVLFPLVLLAASYVAPGVATDPDGLKRFFIILVVAIAMPIVLAQKWRIRNAITAGRITTNWSWLGSLATVPLAFFGTANTASSSLASDLRSGEPGVYASLLIPLLTLALIRAGSALYVRLQPMFGGKEIAPPIASDLHLLQTLPNIFLWFSLLMPGMRDEHPSLIAGTMLGFFVFAFVDEAIVVARFRARVQFAMDSMFGRSRARPRRPAHARSFNQVRDSAVGSNSQFES
jgi:broad specificity phosphatase PhoE